MPERARELDLAGGERPRAELVLQAADPEPVRRPVGEAAWNEEAADPARARGSATRPRGEQELVRVGDRAEPLLAGDPPGLAFGHRLDAVGADVRSALHLCQELRSAVAAVVVGLEQRPQEPLLQLWRAVPPQGPDQTRRTDDGTGVAALAGVREQVEQRRLLERRRGGDAGGTDGPAGPRVLGVERDALGLAPERIRRLKRRRMGA